MSWWRERDPGTFPPRWHAALLKGEGEWLIQHYSTNAGIADARREWRLFMAMLRKFPDHPTSLAIAGLKHRTSQQWSAAMSAWEFRLVARRSVIEEITNIDQVFAPGD